jgi:dihydroorotate dehydrogenase
LFRYGFNSDGADIVAARLADWKARAWWYWPWAWPSSGLLGVNLGKNKDAPATSDYTQGVRKLGPYADYLVVNISSPNTPNLRALQRKADMQALTEAVLAERDALTSRIGKRLPVLVKVSPDLSSEEIAEVAEVSLATKIDGLIVSNTTLQRPVSLCDAQASEVVRCTTVGYLLT